jgi:hypothetical protein
MRFAELYDETASGDAAEHRRERRLLGLRDKSSRSLHQLAQSLAQRAVRSEGRRAIVHHGERKEAQVSADEQGNDKVEEAAAHATRSVEHRRQMQRQSVKAEAADGDDAPALEREAARHGEAAVEQEQAAETAAREADPE